jgi:hypothetical protein
LKTFCFLIEAVKSGLGREESFAIFSLHHPGPVLTLGQPIGLVVSRYARGPAYSRRSVRKYNSENALDRTAQPDVPARVFDNCPDLGTRRSRHDSFIPPFAVFFPANRAQPVASSDENTLGIGS